MKTKSIFDNTETAFKLKSDADLKFTYRGEIDAKGKGKLAMYFVELV